VSAGPSREEPAGGEPVRGDPARRASLAAGDRPPLPFTPRELMVIAAAREIRDGELVFVGMRLPLIAFAFAKRTHAPGAVGLFENGIVRETPAAETLMTMSDTPNVRGAVWSTGTLEILSLLQQGRVDLGFIGGAEIDRHGNLNTSYVGDWRHPTVRLPGSGGGADIASLARRFVVIMPQERHRFRERVDFITSPGHGDGPGWRTGVGLPGGGPSAVITTLGVFRFDPESAEMILASYHPGQSLDTVRAATGWNLRISTICNETPTPTADELAIVRQCDPAGHWTR